MAWLKKTKTLPLRAAAKSRMPSRAWRRNRSTKRWRWHAESIRAKAGFVSVLLVGLERLLDCSYSRHLAKVVLLQLSAGQFSVQCLGNWTSSASGPLTVPQGNKVASDRPQM